MMNLEPDTFEVQIALLSMPGKPITARLSLAVIFNLYVQLISGA